MQNYKFIVVVILAMMGVSFAQTGKDVDPLEFKLKYEDIIKKQIQYIARRSLTRKSSLLQCQRK